MRVSRTQLEDVFDTVQWALGTQLPSMSSTARCPSSLLEAQSGVGASLPGESGIRSRSSMSSTGCRSTHNRCQIGFAAGLQSIETDHQKPSERQMTIVAVVPAERSGLPDVSVNRYCLSTRAGWHEDAFAVEFDSPVRQFQTTRSTIHAVPVAGLHRHLDLLLRVATPATQSVT